MKITVSIRWILLAILSIATLVGRPFAPSSLADGAATGNAPVSVAVIAFNNNSSFPSASVVAENAVTTSVSSSGHFRVVARTQMPEILKNLKFETGSGLVDPNTKNEIGKIHGIDYLIFGTVDSASFQRCINTSTYKFMYNEGKCDLTIYYMKTDTGDIVLSKHLQGSFSNWIDGTDQKALVEMAVRQACNKVVNSLVGANKIEGSVIQLSPDEGYFRIDLGSGNGVSNEMVFAVYDITDVKLPSGKVIHDKNLICYAKPTQIDTEWSKLEPGEVKKDIFGVHWHKKLDQLDPDKASKAKLPPIKLGESVVSTDQTN